MSIPQENSAVELPMGGEAKSIRCNLNLAGILHFTDILSCGRHTKAYMTYPGYAEGEMVQEHIGLEKPSRGSVTVET